MAITIALAGNPNCGKTTLFNALTGANQYVGNWPGVTVEKKEGKLKGAVTRKAGQSPLLKKAHGMRTRDAPLQWDRKARWPFSFIAKQISK